MISEKSSKYKDLTIRALFNKAIAHKVRKRDASAMENCQKRTNGTQEDENRRVRANLLILSVKLNS